MKISRSPIAYPHGMRGLFAWMRARQPRLYAKAHGEVKASALSGIELTDDMTSAAQVTTETGPVSSGVAQRIKDILLGVSQAYLTAEQMKMQKKVIDTQIARAQAGLPPLDIDLSRYGVGPQATVGVSQDTQRLLLWLVAGAGAIYLVPKLLRR